MFRHPVDGWCVGGCWITLAQCDPIETSVQTSSGWMVRQRVLNHSSPMWSNGNQCLATSFIHSQKRPTVMGKHAFVPYWVRWERTFFSYVTKRAIPRNNWHSNFDKEFPIVMTFWNGRMSLSFRVSRVVIRGHRYFSAVPCLASTSYH